MYARTSEAQQYFEREASKSLRPFRNGTTDMPGEPLLIKGSLLDQQQKLQVDLEEATKAIQAYAEIAKTVTDNAERSRLRRELKRLRSNRERIICDKGHLEHILRDGCRLAFETIFVQVANGRLPIDVFEALVAEARHIWTERGYAEVMPKPTRRMKKKYLKRVIRASERASQREANPLPAPQENEP